MDTTHNSRRQFLQMSTVAAAAGTMAQLGSSIPAADDPPPAASGEQPLSVQTDIFAQHVELVLRRSRDEHQRVRDSLAKPGARPVVVGMVQMENRCGGVAGKQANLERMLRAVSAAAANKVQVLAFPEMCLPGYYTRADGTPVEATRVNHALADRVGASESLARLQKAARDAQLVLAFGFCEHDGRDYYNAIGVIDADGAWLGSRRKSPLSPHPHETESFTEPPATKRSAVFKTRYATVGISNCFDGEFPESIRRMRLDGAELLLWCNAGTGNPKTGHSSRINASACYAQSNRMWVACCNAVGGACYGTSVIVGPSGEPLVILPPTGESLGVATTNLAMTADWYLWRQRLDPRVMG